MCDALRFFLGVAMLPSVAPNGNDGAYDRRTLMRHGVTHTRMRAAHPDGKVVVWLAQPTHDIGRSPSSEGRRRW